MDGKMLIRIALACAIAAAPVRAELPEHYPMALSIDDNEVAQVRTDRDIRAALLKCHPPASCGSIYMERDPQIFYSANYEKGGYSISHRSGPPGPDWDARRIGKGNPTHFSTAEMIRITADYIEGRKTPFVRWKSSPLP